MADGTKVKKDGTVMTSDGASSMMNEGDTMSMDGSLTKAGMSFLFNLMAITYFLFGYVDPGHSEC